MLILLTFLGICIQFKKIIVVSEVVMSESFVKPSQDLSIESILIIKIFEYVYIQKDQIRANFNDLVEDISQMSAYQNVPISDIRARVSIALDKLDEQTVICGEIHKDKDGILKYTYSIEEDMEHMAHIMYYEHLLPELIEGMSPMHFDLLNEIVKNKDFCIKGTDLDDTILRATKALELYQMDLIGYQQDDHYRAYPMATVLGVKVNEKEQKEMQKD